MTAQVKTLALDVSTVAASTGVAMNASPFAAGYGRQVIVEVKPIDGGANQVGDIQGSLDGSTGWTDIQAYDAADGPVSFNILLWPYMRVNNESGTTSGTNFQLVA